MESLAFADAPISAQSGAPSPLVSLAPLLVIFAIFYLLLIRPQQKKMKEHKKMIENLKKGDKVITSSGIYATVIGIGETSMEVKLAENVKIKILKSSVTEVLGNQETALPNP